MGRAPPSGIVGPPPSSEALAALARMTAELLRLRDREPRKALRASYTAAIDRLDALAYRLREAAPPEPELQAEREPPSVPASPSERDSARPASEPRATNTNRPVIVVARRPARR